MRLIAYFFLLPFILSLPMSPDFMPEPEEQGEVVLDTVANAPRTTIETYYENCTRTVIIEITEPTTIPTTTESTTTVAETTTEAIDNSTTVTHLAEIPVEGETGPADTASASTVSLPEGFTINEASSNSSSLGNVASRNVSENVRLCSCDEASICRKESASSINECMSDCDEYLQEYGNQTESYLDCFSKNTAGIIEAENCLFNKLTDYCSTSNETQFFDRPNWRKLTDIRYESNTDDLIKNNYFWKRDESKYNHIQRYFHCTKHCMHRKMNQCAAAKGCGIRMQERKQLKELMRGCTKNNYKISLSILSACQCLAWRQGVTGLRGSCVVIGNQFYVDRA